MDPAGPALGSGFSMLAWGHAGKGLDRVSDAWRVVDVDLDNTPETRVRELVAGKHYVVCYLSAGTLETFRADYNANVSAWQTLAVGAITGWANEAWLDMSSPVLRELLRPRFERAAAKGCSAVEPDNVDCALNAECWGKIASLRGDAAAAIRAQLSFNMWQSDLAHSLGLGIGLKNTLDLVPQLVGHYDFAVVESCLEFDECKLLQPFAQAGKAILAVEYRTTDCALAGPNQLALKFCKGKDGNTCLESSPWVSCFADDCADCASAAAGRPGAGVLAGVLAGLLLAGLVAALVLRSRLSRRDAAAQQSALVTA
jgi:hypothetical protein